MITKSDMDCLKINYFSDTKLPAVSHHASTLLSNHWITGGSGTAIQHLHYLPYKKLRFFSSLAFGNTNKFVLLSLPASAGEEQIDQRLTSFNSRYTFSAKEKDIETGYSYFGARYYTSDLSIWLSVDPMSDKYPSLSPYVYCNNNPVILVDPNGRDWVLITGNKTNWYGGKAGDKSDLMYTYNSASGMNEAHLKSGGIINLQQAKYQNVRNGGPTPEGRYMINLKPDPNRVAQADPNTGELLRNSEGGIEKIPNRVDAGGGKFFTYEVWGKNRAYLQPVEVTGATSEQRNNNSYYIHDSDKGYTHGCTEVDSDFFNQLNNYRNAGNEKIDVIVEYPDPNHKTNGNSDE